VYTGLDDRGCGTHLEIMTAVSEADQGMSIDSARQHAVIRRIMILIGGFSDRTGLGSEEAMILLALMLVAHSDSLRHGTPIEEARAILGVISQLTGIPKETVRRKLKKLADLDILEQQPDSVYVLNAANTHVMDILSGLQAF